MVEEGRLDISDVQSSEEGESLDEIQARRKRGDKIRWDHRHHLLDAIVAACTTRSDVQRLQTLAARDTGDESASEILAQVRRADPDFRNAGICWRPDFWKTAKAFLKDRRREGAAGEQLITSVVVKADHDPRGKLHEATNYGLICDVPGERDKYVARDHVSILDLTAEQIEALNVRGKLIRKVERAKEQGAQFWWGGHDPVSSMRNLAGDLKKMRARLLELMENAPPEALEKARTDRGRQKARAEWAKKQYIAKTGRRRFTRVQIVSLRVLKGPLEPGQKPRQANPTGGNDRLIYFVNGEGDRDIEVVSTLDANTPGFRERWRREGGRLLFVLRRNDLVEMVADPKNSDSLRRLYRTVSFSNTGRPDLEFVPVEEARSGRPPKHIRISSKTDFSARAPVVVVCDPTGRVRWRGPRLN